MRKEPVLDAAWLSRVTAWYLERYTSSTANLRRLLRARIRRRGGDESVLALVEPELQRLQDCGLLNDSVYAADKARTLHHRGTSGARIRAALRGKGVDAEQVVEAIESLHEEAEDPELTAARTWARKRRLGPWRATPADPDQRRKESARMGRAGFGWDIVRATLDGSAD
jgi:regulatory protein